MASDPEAVKQRRADNLRKAREAKQRKAIEQHQANVPPVKDPEPKQRPSPPPQEEKRQEDYYSEGSGDDLMDDALDNIDLDVSDSELEDPVPKKKKQSKAPSKPKSKLVAKPIVVDPPRKKKSPPKSRDPPPKKRKREEEEDSDSEEEEEPKQRKKKSKKNEPGVLQKLYAKAENLDLSDEAINYLGTVVGILGVLVYIRNRPATGTVGNVRVIPDGLPPPPAPSPHQPRGDYYTPAAELGQPVLYR